MTKYFSWRIMTDVLLVLAVLVSVLMMTIVATSLGEPIRTSIAASIPASFLATAEASKPKFARVRPSCRLRSAPLQWNVDWPFQSPAAQG